MKIKRIIAVLFILIMTFTLAACSSSSRLSGSWARIDVSDAADPDDFPRIMYLSVDGECTVEGYKGRWLEDDGTLIFLLEYKGQREKYKYNYKFSEKKLSLYDENNAEEYATFANPVDIY